MTLQTFNLADAIEKLKEVDIQEHQAKATVKIFAESHVALATKLDLDCLRQDFQQLEAKFELLEAKFKLLETKTLSPTDAFQGTIDALAFKPKTIIWGLVICVLAAFLSNAVFYYLGLV